MIAEWALLLLPLVMTAEEAWIPARPDYEWSFPGDHWSHPRYRTEWWYFTGHLESREGRRFGYQFTFFRVGLTPDRPAGESRWNAANLVMGHAAISDLDRGEHRFSELVFRETPFLGGFGESPDPLLVWSQAPAGTEGRWQLSWNGRAFDFSARDDTQNLAFSLSTVPAKPRIYQGPGGYSRKGSGSTSASQYYSYTRLQTSGQITFAGETHAVTGSSWMDKEFGSNQLEEDQVGWDWFSLQLDDERELMLYLLRREDGTVAHASGTLVDRLGEVRYLAAEEFEVAVRDEWSSEESGITYPARWKIRLPESGEVLEVVPEFADQENRSRLLEGLHYWEGAVQVRGLDGAKVGQGYVELTGYGDATRPGI